MSALAIVAICVFGAFGYCLAAAYVYMRLLWYGNERGTYDPEVPAFFAAVLLPVGASMLVIQSLTEFDRNGLAPRSVRQERKLKDQAAEIARLEKELEIR